MGLILSGFRVLISDRLRGPLTERPGCLYSCISASFYYVAFVWILLLVILQLHLEAFDSGHFPIELGLGHHHDHATTESLALQKLQ